MNTNKERRFSSFFVSIRVDSWTLLVFLSAIAALLGVSAVHGGARRCTAVHRSRSAPPRGGFVLRRRVARNTTEHPGTPRNTSEHLGTRRHGTSGNIPEHCGTSWNIRARPIEDARPLTETIGRTGEFWGIPGNGPPSQIVKRTPPGAHRARTARHLQQRLHPLRTRCAFETPEAQHLAPHPRWPHASREKFFAGPVFLTRRCCAQSVFFAQHRRPAHYGISAPCPGGAVGERADLELLRRYCPDAGTAELASDTRCNAGVSVGRRRRWRIGRHIATRCSGPPTRRCLATAPRASRRCA
jgi:hypothetical protein